MCKFNFLLRTTLIIHSKVPFSSCNQGDWSKNQIMWLPKLTWQRAAESGRTKVSEHNHMCKNKHIFKWARPSSICTLQFILHQGKHSAEVTRVDTCLVGLRKTSASAKIWINPYHFLCLMKKYPATDCFLPREQEKQTAKRGNMSVLVSASCDGHVQWRSQLGWTCPHSRPLASTSSQLR